MFDERRYIQNAQADTSLGLDTAAEQTAHTIESLTEERFVDLSSLVEGHAQAEAQAQLSDLMTQLDTNGDGMVSVTEMRAGATNANLQRMVQEGIIDESMASKMGELARHHRVHGAISISVPEQETDVEPSVELDAEAIAEAEGIGQKEPSLQDILEAMGTPQGEKEAELQPNALAEKEQLQEGITEHQQELLDTLLSERLKVLQDLGMATPEKKAITQEIEPLAEAEPLVEPQLETRRAVEPMKVSLGKEPSYVIGESERLDVEPEVSLETRQETRFSLSGRPGDRIFTS